MKNFLKHMPVLLGSVCFLQSATIEADRYNATGGTDDAVFMQGLPALIPDQTAPDQQQPDLKKAADQLSKAKKPSLLKTLTEFVKFKKKADKKFDTKMLSAIEKLGWKDSIAATNSNIQAMITALRKEKNQDFDSVKSILDALVQRQKNEVHPGNAQTALADLPGSASPSNFDLETLAGELLPLINQKTTEEQGVKEKNEKLRLISKIKNAGSKTIYTLKLSDNVTRNYTLALKNKAEVFGFYDASSPAAEAAAFFNPSNALVYYALPLNESTGNFDNLNGWDTCSVVSLAQEKGSKVYFSMLMPNRTGTSPFLYNQAAKEKCISNGIALLKQRDANGINISFKNLRSKDKEPFSAFIQLFFRWLKKEDPDYKLYITIPRTDMAGAYDMETLKEYADKFFIDFSTNTANICAPLAPLTGGSQQTIETSVSWYLAHGINPDKMAVILPYRGTRWLMNPASTAGSFVDYASFADIQRISNGMEIYDEESTSVYTDTMYRKNYVCRIWFDNEATLGKKFDYILKNGIGGAGLYYINYDGFYNELNNELMYKFTTIDTTYIKENAAVKPAELSFFQKLQRHIALYDYILQNPCASCFENAAIDPEERAMLSSYLKDLGFDSLIEKDKEACYTSSKGKKPAKHFSITVKDEFSYVNRELNTLLKYVSLLFFIVSCGFVAFYIYGIKYYEGDWRYKKLVAGILVVLISLFVFFGLTFCFTSDLIPLFGVSGTSFNKSDCSIDPNCINIPFTTLLLIIFLSMILGLLIFRYFITPILKRDNLP